MSPSPYSTAIIIVHGSYHTPTHYGSLASALQTHSFTVSTPFLPTMRVSTASPLDTSALTASLTQPAGGWPDSHTDAEVIKAEIRKLADEGKRVLLAAHSYGGFVASEAAVAELQERNRRKEGKKGGVVGIVFMPGFVVAEGEGLDSFFAPPGDTRVTFPEWLELVGTPPNCLVIPKDPARFFYSDLAETEARTWIAAMRPQPIIASKLTRANYVDVPCAILKCTKDAIFQGETMENMIQTARDQGGRVDVYECEAGHSPMLSNLDRVVEALVDFAGKV